MGITNGITLFLTDWSINFLTCFLYYNLQITIEINFHVVWAASSYAIIMAAHIFHSELFYASWRYADLI